MWVWICIGILLVILVTIWLSDIQIHLQFRKFAHNDEITLQIRLLFGLVKLDYKVPRLTLEGWQKGLTYRQKETDNVFGSHNKEHVGHLDFEKLKQKHEKFQLLINATSGWKIWYKQFLRKIRVTKMNWSTDIGIGSAADTAVATGVVWAVKSVATGWAAGTFRFMQNPRLAVYPQFHTPQFATELDCIAKIRFGQAIVAGLALIVRVLKVKGGLRTWQNILFKA